jgi:hypothetical protein
MARTFVVIAAATLAMCESWQAHCSEASVEPAAASDTASAAADTEDPRVGEAREAFRSGTTLARRGQWSEALQAFERSASLRSHPVTSYDIAYCERALGRYTRAAKGFRAALAERESARTGRMSEPMAAQATKYLVEVEAKLVRAHVTLSPRDGAIAVDGVPLEKGEVAAGPIPVFIAGTREPGAPESTGFESFDVLLDPGNHVFVTKSRGEERTVITRDVAAGATLSLNLRVPEARVSPAEAPREVDRGVSGWTYAAYGLGAAGLTAGGGFGIAALVKRSSLDAVCGSPPRCPPSASPEIDAARGYARASDIGFAVAALGAAFGTFLLLSSGGPRHEKSSPGGHVRDGSAEATWLAIGPTGVTGRF